MAEKKLTKRDIFEAVANYAEITEEMADFASEVLDKMDEANAKAREKAKAKRAEAGPSNVEAVNAKIAADAVLVLSAEPMTREQVLEAMGDYTYEKADGSEADLTVQKLSTVLAKAVEAGKCKKTKALIGDSVKTCYVK